MIPLPRFTTGDPAVDGALDEWAGAIERANSISADPGSPIEAHSGDPDLAIRLGGRMPTLARLGGSSSPYSWTEVVPSPAGGWVTPINARSGSRAFEVNSRTGLDGRVVRLIPGAGDDWRFQYVRFGDQSKDEVSLPQCPCPKGPKTLYMTSSKPESNFGLFQNAKLVYGPVPPEYVSLLLPANAYLSTETFTELSHGDRYRYYLRCTPASFALHRLFASSYFGGPLLDLVRYLWVPGVLGNSCKPFAMLNGQIYSGGDASCIVTITA